MLVQEHVPKVKVSAAYSGSVAALYCLQPCTPFLSSGRTEGSSQCLVKPTHLGGPSMLS